MQPKNAFNCNISLMLRKHENTIFISASIMIERELVQKGKQGLILLIIFQFSKSINLNQQSSVIT